MQVYRGYFVLNCFYMDIFPINLFFLQTFQPKGNNKGVWLEHGNNNSQIKPLRKVLM